MTSNGFEKFYGYKHGTVWIKIFLFAYIYVGIFAYAAIYLTKLSKTDFINEISQTLTGGGLTFSAVYAVVTLLLLASFVLCGVFLPLINMKSYYSVMIHLWSIIAYRPVMLISSWLLLGEVQKSYIILSGVMFVISLVFAVVNFAYFTNRRDLFESSINEIIMGEKKDELKH